MELFPLDTSTYFIRLDKGEELIQELTKLAQEKNISSAHITAIGACGELTLAYYNLSEKKYEDHDFHEDMEITSIIGNIGQMDAKPIIHAHGTFSRRDMSITGGHVKKLIVSATCEITLSLFPLKLGRAFDESTGLNLIRNSS